MARTPPIEDLGNWPHAKHALILAPDPEIEDVKMETYIEADQDISEAIATFTHLGFKHIGIVSPFYIGPNGLIWPPSNAPTRTYPNEEASLEESLLHIKSIAKPRDLLCIYITGHGRTLDISNEVRIPMLSIPIKDRPQSSSTMFPGNHLLDLLEKTEVAEMPRVAIAEQCYGFGFVSDLVTKPRSLAISAAPRTQIVESRVFAPTFFNTLYETGHLRTAFNDAYSHALLLNLKDAFPRIITYRKGKKIVRPRFDQRLLFTETSH